MQEMEQAKVQAPQYLKLHYTALVTLHTCNRNTQEIDKPPQYLKCLVLLMIWCNHYV
jgi:hypothetical protein